jgi:1-acyl-sn-glycerol-3-phosphate acyltransferase
VNFHGRSGFASIAREAGVPVVPVVTAGAGESLFVATDGARIAAALQLPRLFRYNVAPVSLSIPWGISVGVAGLLPYLPLPTKLETTVLPSMRPGPDQDDDAFAARVQRAMQEAMDAMTADRRPLLG